MTRALLFPGQGSQAVGMGRDLASAFAPARQVFEEVDEALKQNLSHLMFEGPEAELTLTENAQPALMAVSLAAVRTLEREGGFDLGQRVSYVAGHSLGEYSALAAAGTFALADAARLLKTRGRAMQEAASVGVGAMAALLGLDLDAARAVAAEAAQGEVCDAANDNAPGQVVVSGHKAAVERAVVLAKTKGAKRAMLLPVSAPFHCALMAPAAEVMVKALADVQMHAPKIPVVANVTARPVGEIGDIRRRLAEQVTGMVRWRESVEFLKAGGVTQAAELGAGKVLAGLGKRIAPEIAFTSVGVPAEVEGFLKTL
jgi:[acyl-carrier-protein] S-malonyltransferase